MPPVCETCGELWKDHELEKPQDKQCECQCGLCYFNHSQPTEPLGWEVTLAEFFVDYDSVDIATYNKVKVFIQSLLDSQRAEIIEKIKKSKPKTYTIKGKKYNHSFGGQMALDQYERELLKEIEK